MNFMIEKGGSFNELDEDIHPEFVGEKNIPFDEEFFRKFIDTSESFTLERMHHSYGVYMIGHTRRVGFFQEQLLVACGVDPDIARKVGMLMLPHDLGKTHKDQKDLYVLTEDKPLKDSFKDQEKRLHAALGPAMTNFVLQIMKTNRQELPPATRIWLTVSDYLQTGHHKTFHARMGLVERCACVSDAIDGQLKTLCPVPLDQLNAEDMMTYRDKAIDKLLNTPKFDGQYDRDILLKAKEVNWALRPGISAPSTLEMGLDS